MWENRGVRPLILNLGTGWRWEVSCTPWLLYFQGLCSPYPLIRRLGLRQSQPGRLEERRPCPARNWTTISQFLSFYDIWYDMIYDILWYDIYDMIYDILWYDIYDMIHGICAMIWYDMIWYDMIWYDMIWCDMIWYDMIYLLTAIWLTTGGSSTVHIYTQTIRGTTRLTTRRML
jgi:hypothetical protein